jgi:hypothetical protein
MTSLVAGDMLGSAVDADESEGISTRVEYLLGKDLSEFKMMLVNKLSVSYRLALLGPVVGKPKGTQMDTHSTVSSCGRVQLLTVAFLRKARKETRVKFVDYR